MKRNVLQIFSILLILSIIAGCSPAEVNTTADVVEPAKVVEEATEAPTDVPTEEPTAEPTEVKNVFTDELGREVEIPENPEVIVGLTSAVIETLFDLGFTPAAKVEEYKIREEGMALPSVGNVQELNMEAIYALEPDLIIASSRFHASLEEELVASGAVVYFFDPDKVGAIPLVELRAYLGNLLDRETEGQAYVDNMNAYSEELKTQVDATGIETAVVMKMGESIMCAQSASSFGSMLNLLGLENIVPDDLPNSSKSSLVKYDAEKIVADNPDIIILMAASKEKEANQEMLQKFMNDEKWAALDAVQNGMVFVAPFAANPNRSTPEKMLQLYASILPLE
jgi:iron complex transport system substrate-binding protein